MASPETPKPATAFAVNRPRKADRLGGTINSLDTQIESETQAFRRGVPRKVIFAEIVATRDWQEVVSTGGVKSWASRIGKCPLVLAREAGQ